MTRAGLAFAVAFVLGAAATAEAGLIVRQRSNGIPGRGSEEVVSATLLVGEHAFRLEERVPDARYTLVRLDREKIFEVDPKLQQYTEQDFAYFRRQREKAEADREATRQLIVERFQGEERARELARRRLREDGRQVVTVERAPGEPINGYNTRRTSILVNGAAAIVLYATDEIKEYAPPRALFEFYDRSGLFREEVMAELRKVEGFPVRIYANVDFWSAGAEIRSEVETVADWPEDGRALEVPPHFVKVDELPSREALAAAATKAPPSCALCGKKIEGRAPEKMPGRSDVVFCSADHMVEYITKLKNR